MKRILKWALLAVAALVVIVVCSGVVYQQVATWRDARRFPQRGRLVQLGPEFPVVSLHMDCSGQGTPAVILESGLGVPALGWYQVQPSVAAFTRVCSYDRAGYGWSTAGPMPRSSDQIVKELHALLKASGEKGPYVFVAHSFGGFNARIYKSRYPAEVVGVVLVDSSQEDQESRMTPGLQAFMQEQKKQLKSQMSLAPLLIYSGLARLTTSLEGPASLSPEIKRELRYLELQTEYIRATGSEMLFFDESADQVRMAGDLGDLPLIVLTAGKTAEEGLPKNLDKKELQAFQEIWINELQVKEAHLSMRGKQVIVAESDHMIPIEKPQTIVEATREIVEGLKLAPKP